LAKNWRGQRAALLKILAMVTLDSAGHRAMLTPEVGMRIKEREIRGLLIDLDGVLFVGGKPIPGAVEIVCQLVAARMPRCYLTNTTTKSAASLQKKLQDMGFAIKAQEILSAPEAARVYLENKGRPVCKLLVNDEVLGDFRDFKQSDTGARVVVIGDIGNAWTYDLLNNVFRLAMNGAELVALHRNKFWQTEAGLQMDIGAFVAGLEYVTGKTATVMGKPSVEFFAVALSRIGLKPGEVAMIGDDIDTDIGAAREQGMMGILVKTGKYREAYVQASMIKPDLVLDSIADLAVAS
jgi:HAD superfamily hydrolase (TIGR01458 family)